MRFPPVEVSSASPRQRAVAEKIAARSGQTVSGHHLVLLHAPEIADRVYMLEEHLRTGLQIPERLRALTILMAAARYRASDTAHFMEAESIRQSGLAQSTMDAIASGTTPTAWREDERLVHAFCSDLSALGRVRNSTFDSACAVLGRVVCLEIVKVYGYARYLTMLLNITQTRLADTGC